jgi:beta-galactosidase/beta-glucuronidase
MKPINGIDCLWAYDSINEIYMDKVLPEFGLVPTKWQFPLSEWRFFYAEDKDLIPSDAFIPDYDDSSWERVTLPSVWQQEGHGFPMDLLYDAAEKEQANSLYKRLQVKLSTSVSRDIEEDIGIYRTRMVIPRAYLDRAVYFCTSGIRGRFTLYVNGHEVSQSGACYTTKRLLLSPFLAEGQNTISVMVYRMNSDSHGRRRKENGTFGFAGIFRMPEIIAEPLVEVSGLHIHTTWEDTSVNSTMGPDDSDQSFHAEDPGNIRFAKEAVRRRDGRIRIDVAFHNHTDLTVPVHVSFQLIEARPEYDLYNLPMHPIREMKKMEGSIAAGSDLTLQSELSARSVLPWSDSYPFLYDLVFTVQDTHDRIISVRTVRFGFRTSEVIARVFHLNDTALPLKAVRYFSFDPIGGLAVPYERFRQDICMMKQAGINTVITAHFPADPVFYRMCDEYGLYVISQADSMYMKGMFEALMSHPSIVFWSFAPLHFDESKVWEQKQKLLILDGSRPFYCEADRSLSLSDIPPFPCDAGVLFGEWSDICLDKSYLQSKLKPGHFVFEKQKGRAKREMDSADIKWIHQGDIEEFHERTEVPIAQGIVSADRIPHPIYFEVKKQCETLHIVSSLEDPADLSLNNLHPIGETGELILFWQLLLGGVRLTGGQGPVPSIPPLGKRNILFPFKTGDFLEENWMTERPGYMDAYRTAVSRELVLDIRLSLKDSSAYAPAGHEIAFYQQVLVEKTAGMSETFEQPVSEADSNPEVPETLGNFLAVADKNEIAAVFRREDSPIIKSRPDALLVSSKDLELSFSRRKGGLSSLLSVGREMLAGSFRPSFYRAATNTDRTDRSFVLAATVFSKETDWRTIQNNLVYSKSDYEMEGQDFTQIVHYKSAAFRNEVLVCYRMSASGVLSVSLACTPRYPLQRYGFRVRIPKNMNRILWYGRGLLESYPDRKESSRIGLYESTPADTYHEYARPQENGSHTDTAYLIFCDETGYGLKITSADD